MGSAKLLAQVIGSDEIALQAGISGTDIGTCKGDGQGSADKAYLD